MEYNLTPHPSPRRFPKELQDLPQWVCFRLVEKPGNHKLDKWPFNPSYSNRMAKVDDPNSWSSFDHAMRVYEAHPNLDGVGFVFTANDPYCGIDFDCCVKNDRLDPWVQEWVERLGGYAELSPSGKGVHVIVKARLKGTGKKRTLKDHEVEVYDRLRFFSATGAALQENQPPVQAQGVVDDLYSKLSPPPHEELEIKRLRAPVLANEEVVTKAGTAASGYKFGLLYHRGEWQRFGYSSQSEADYGLVRILAFWTGGDRDQVADLFEQSAMYRPEKEKRSRGYVSRTVDRALASYTGAYYDPAHRSEGVRERLDPYFRLIESPIRNGRKWPSARKVLAGVLLTACEHGSHSEDGVRVGIDMRTLSEVAHVSLKTLLYSSLPLLTKEGLLKWTSKGKEQRASHFVIPDRVKVKHSLFTRSKNVLPSHASSLGTEERRQLLRASQGRSPYAAIPRVGNRKQVLLEHLASTPGNRLAVAELVGLTGRRGADIRRDLRHLCGLNLVFEVASDAYRLPADFWDRWEEVLVASGVTNSERRKKEAHARARERQEEAARLMRQGWRSEHRGCEQVWIHQETGEVVSRETALSRVGDS